MASDGAGEFGSRADVYEGTTLGQEVLVVGHSMLPKGTATRSVHGMLSIVALVDRSTHRVIDSSITLTTEMSQRWVAAQLKDEDLTMDPSPFVQRVEENYWGPAQRAIIQCFRDLQKRYEEGCSGQSVQRGL